MADERVSPEKAGPHILHSIGNALLARTRIPIYRIKTLLDFFAPSTEAGAELLRCREMTRCAEADLNFLNLSRLVSIMPASLLCAEREAGLIGLALRVSGATRSGRSRRRPWC